MKTAYFDIISGAGGDMIVAAILSAGLDPNFLTDQLASLNLSDLTIEFGTSMPHGISSAMFIPKTSEKHPHRHLSDIIKIIDQSAISDSAKSRAKKIFDAIAIAEAKIHNTEPQKIHFHEVGAVDSIADIVAACVGFDALGIEKVYSSPLTLGSGIIKCAHGQIPAPAPATLEIIKSAGAPTVPGPVAQELITPTAAAIITEFTDEYGKMPPMTIDSIGYGAGTRQSDEFPNVLRLVTGQLAQTLEGNADSIAVLETNIDDATGETIGFTLEMLMENGALDAWTTPIQMKHNRPAVTLSVICPTAEIAKYEQLIFAQGITFGIRRQIMQRSKLIKEIKTVDTKFGPIRIKTGSLNGKQLAAKPEYKDCANAAKQHNVSINTVTQEAANYNS